MRLARRDFIKSAAAGMAVFSTSAMLPNWVVRSANAIGEQSTQDRVLVLIQLEGGNDGLNTVVPFEDDRYYQARPVLGITRSSVLPISDLCGLNPNLRELQGWYYGGKVAVVQNVGYPNPDLSHFTSTDYWHQGRVAGDHATYGWLARSIDRNSYTHAIANPMLMTSAGGERVPDLLNGSSYFPVVIANEDSFQIVGSSDSGLGDKKDTYAERRLRDIQALNAIQTSHPELDFIGRCSVSASEAIDLVQKLPPDSTTTYYPDTKLGRDLRLCSKLIRSGQFPRVLHVRQPGYDTHAQQDSAHPVLLQELNDALHAFMLDLTVFGLMDRVLVMTYSEFGRRVAENVSKGTDHGAGSLLFVLGGTVKPGIYGGQPNLENLQQGSLMHQIDFRSVYSDVLRNWFMIDPAGLFSSDFPPVGFLQTATLNSVQSWDLYQ